ncbi:hypothetical protein NEICINOT_04962 [Neisseria cinerea ATCC 14685]|uniref:Uncharacterized protein n=1 Tax=Neisseria cinerea ATCC 14685 TaxID=546262 RepID=D0W5J3_NEICI|nr:hypothetical protein NEICINOT_04962 [Neisseria cinerea ATCC 14685]
MKRIFLSALPIILPLSAYADLPLTIEDMMTDKGKLETGNFPYLPEQRKQPHQTCRASLHPNRRNLVYPHSDRNPRKRQQYPFRRHPLQIGQLPAAQPQHLICRQRQNQPDRRHPMVEQAARPDGKTGILRKHIHLRPFRRRFRLHPNHSFKRIRAFQRFMAKQFRTEIWRTAYILSRF